MAGAKVIDGELHPHLVELAKQGEGLRAGHQQLPLRELQHQHHPSRHEVAEEVAALRHQGEVPAVDGTDVEADVKCLGQLLLHRVECLGHRLHQVDRHGHDQARLFRLGDEEIGADQPLGGMLPAHQYLCSHHLAALAGDQRLQIGDKFPGSQPASQLVRQGPRPPKQPPHQQ